MLLLLLLVIYLEHSFLTTIENEDNATLGMVVDFGFGF